MDLTDLSGELVDCSQFSGKVLVLNFWTTRCGPCVAELPSLQGLMDRTADLGVQFALVTPEPADVVRRFAEERLGALPAFLLSGQPPDCFRSRAVPTTFVLNKNGVIAMRHLGAAKWDDETVVDFVRGLATTPPA